MIDPYTVIDHYIYLLPNFIGICCLFVLFLIIKAVNHGS